MIVNNLRPYFFYKVSKDITFDATKYHGISYKLGRMKQDLFDEMLLHVTSAVPKGNSYPIPVRTFTGDIVIPAQTIIKTSWRFFYIKTIINNRKFSFNKTLPSAMLKLSYPIEILNGNEVEELI